MKYGLMMVLLLTLIVVNGCSKIENANNLTVTVGKENIKCIKLNDANDSFRDNKKAIFKLAFENNALSDINYIKNDEKVYLDFGSNPPDKLVIKDSLLYPNGDYLYTEKETIEVPFIKDGNKFYFIIKKHFASALSSVYLENKTDLRGLRIKASWGKNEYVYALVIKTDAF